MNIISKTDFDQICRSCLNKSPLIDIFGTAFEGKMLSELLSELSLIQSAPNTELPTKLCENCVTEVVRFYIFKTKFAEAEKQLRTIVNRSKVGETIPNIYEIGGTVILGETDNDSIQLDESSGTPSDFADDSEDDEDLTSDDSAAEEEQLRNEYNIPQDLEVQIIGTKQFKHELEEEGYVFNVVLDGKVQIMTESELKTPPVYKCICGETFTNNSVYMNHRKESKHWKLTTCTVCGKTFNKYRMNIHMRRHTKEKPYVCEICGRGFSMWANHKRHLRIHTGEKPYVCDICGAAFNQSTAMAKHRTVHTNERPFNCELCGQQFKHTADVRKHMRNQHSPFYESNVIMSGNNVAVCKICNKAFAKSSIYQHMRVHREKQFLCVVCGKRLLTKTSLNSHSLIHTGEKPYTCKVCFKSFRQGGSLNQHLLIHTGVKPHVCHFCGKSFTQTAHLNRHLLIHTGEKPHPCKYCGKGFSTRKNATVHMRIHTGEKPYVCSVCSKGFYDSNALKKHRKVHMKER